MNKYFVIIASIFVLGLLILFAIFLQQKRDVKQAKGYEVQPDVMGEMRDKLFSTSPDDLGLAPTTQLPNVWGIVMEIGIPEGYVTLFSLAEGTTSLYFSNGGGIIGSGQHKSVRDSSTDFLNTAEQFLPSLNLSNDESPPSSGMIKFHALTYTGTYTIEDKEESISDPSNPIYPLFVSGNDVITQIRLIEEGLHK
jgi:hypothetical protein